MKALPKPYYLVVSLKHYKITGFAEPQHNDNYKKNRERWT